MSGFLPDPTRWKDRTDQANLAERAAGQAIRSLDNAAPLSPTQLTRIAARIRAERSRPHPRRFWLAAAASLLVLGTAMASAAHLKLLPRWLTVTASPPALPPPATRPARPQPRVPAPTAQPAAKPADAPPVAIEPADSERPTLEREVSALAPPRVTTRKAAQRPLAMHTLPSQNPIPLAPPPSETPPAIPTPAGPPNPSPPMGSAESPAIHLTKAIRALRVEQSPEAALALLDRHAPTLNQSDFRHEALLLRVEALLKLQRPADALRLLEATPLTEVPAARTLLLIRGELRATTGHCVDALADFDRVLSQTHGHNRRALLGLVKCHKQMGNEAAARAERERYRREFPNPRDDSSP